MKHLGDSVESDSNHNWIHDVEPRAVGRREVRVEAWAPGQPVPNEERLVGPVVVHDDVHTQRSEHLGVAGSDSRRRRELG